MKNTFYASMAILAILTVSIVTARAATLRHKLVGTSSWSNTASFSACQPSPNTDLQAQRFVAGMLQGMIRFKWTFYKDGQPIKTDEQFYDLRGAGALNFQNFTYQSTFYNMSSAAGTYYVNLEIKRGKWKPFFWEYSDTIANENSSLFTITNIVPTNSFKIRNSAGVFVSPPTGGLPIQVSLSGGIIMDASATQCATGYLIIVQESDAWWNRTNLNELDKKWISGQPPANLNLQQFVTTYSQSDGTGYFSLIGGNYTSGPFNGQPRFYRIGLQAAGAPWNPRMTLIRVNW